MFPSKDYYKPTRSSVLRQMPRHSLPDNLPSADWGSDDEEDFTGKSAAKDKTGAKDNGSVATANNASVAAGTQKSGNTRNGARTGATSRTATAATSGTSRTGTAATVNVDNASQRYNQRGL